MSFVVLNGDPLGVVFVFSQEAEIHVPQTVLILDIDDISLETTEEVLFCGVPKLGSVRIVKNYSGGSLVSHESLFSSPATR